MRNMAETMPYRVTVPDELYLPTSNAVYLQLKGIAVQPAPAEEFLREIAGMTGYDLFLWNRYGGYPQPRHRRPRAAADRTTSRRRAAGTRRTKRHGAQPKGPKREGWVNTAWLALHRGHRGSSSSLP